MCRSRSVCLMCVCACVCATLLAAEPCWPPQNGSLLDSILLWKSNIDKRFDGVEDCVICYAIVHGTNYKLPTEVR